MRDATTQDYPLFTSDWESSQQYRFEYPVDKVFNNDIFNQGQTFFDEPRMRDEWLGARFYYTPTENVFLTTELAHAAAKPSIR